MTEGVVNLGDVLQKWTRVPFPVDSGKVRKLSNLGPSEMRYAVTVVNFTG